MSEFMQKIDRLTSKFASQDTCELCAVEELAELIMAIQHKCRNRPANLAEEMAQVIIMIEAVRKKYAVEVDEILFYEHDMVERYLNDEVWDASHVKSQVRHNVRYSRNGKEYTFMTHSYKDAMKMMEKMRDREDITILAYYPSDAQGVTPLEVSTWV